MEQVTIKNFYDEIFEFFDNNCTKTDRLKHLAGINVLIIAVGMKTQIASLIAYLNQGEEKPAHIYIVVQKNMIPVVTDLENEQCHFIEWSGPYTLDVIHRVSENIDPGEISCLFYQGRRPLDFRDVNLYDILLEIKEKYKNDCEIYMQDIQEQVHWYRTPEKIRKGMDVYRAVDAYLEV